MNNHTLISSDYENLERSYILPDLAASAGIYRVHSLQGLGLVGQHKSVNDYNGLVFPYYVNGQHVLNRLRLDHPGIGPEGEEIKYLVGHQDRNHIYFPPARADQLADMLADIRVPVIITEGEKKCLALWRLALEEQEGGGPRFLPLGLGGVWNLRGTIGRRVDANGVPGPEKGIIPDIELVTWCGRRVLILFDADVETKEGVRAARADTTKELRDRQARVFHFTWPKERPPRAKGIDDLLGVWKGELVWPLIEQALTGLAIGEKPAPKAAPLPPREHATESYQANCPEPVPLIDPILYPGLTILGGRPKAGKSWFALQLAIAAVNQFKLASYLAIEKKCRVLYVSLEDRKPQLKKRLHHLVVDETYLNGLDIMYELAPLMDGGAQQLDATLAADPVDILIVDSLLAAVQQSSRKYQDIMQTDYNIIRVLRTLAWTHSLALILVAHTRKAPGDFLDMIQGTSGTTAAADAVWVLGRTAEGQATLSVTGREVPMNVFGLARANDSPAWIITGEGDEVTQSDVRQDILLLLRENGPMKLGQMASKLRKPPSNTHRILCSLCDLHLVVRTHYGTYQLVKPESGKSGESSENSEE